MDNSLCEAPVRCYFSKRPNHAIQAVIRCCFQSRRPRVTLVSERFASYFFEPRSSIKLSSLQVLLPVASLLQVSSVREACCKFLLRQLHPSNCLGIRQFADAHSCDELHRKSHKYALQNFQDVALTEEFLLLPFCEVR